jgi:DNA integrity scanning protein DisA with diadenylate cyclase activity
MVGHRSSKSSSPVVAAAAQLAVATDADALLLLLDEVIDWKKLKAMIGELDLPIIVAHDSPQALEGASEAGLHPLPLHREKAPLLERLQHALLEAVSLGLLAPNGECIAVYSGFERGRLDSISHLQLDERLRRLSVRDLQRLKSSVPLKSLKQVIDLAVAIGHEGREAKRVGTILVIGDTRRVLEHCKDAGVDPFRGYSRKQRSLFDPRVQEDVKEIAQLDGAFIISPDGIVEKSRQMLEVNHEELQLSKGLGARHWAGAAISRRTKAIAIVVSESNGTVRIYQAGELVMRIEPRERAVKWQEFVMHPPSAADGD